MNELYKQIIALCGGIAVSIAIYELLDLNDQVSKSSRIGGAVVSYIHHEIEQEKAKTEQEKVTANKGKKDGSDNGTKK